MITLPPDDIEHVLTGTSSLWEDLRGKTLFITGGTGFFGCWLLETFVEANRRHNLQSKAIILSRDPAAFAQRVPALARCPELIWIRGSILELTVDYVSRQLRQTNPDFSDLGSIKAVVHLVTEANLDATANKPLTAIDVIAQGTRNALEFAAAVGASRFLFTSSGAVYGRQPADLTTIPETYTGAPDHLDASSTYASAGEAKRYAELLCAAFARERGLAAVIARGFSFVGPYLPLDSKFAIGNFLNDALHHQPITIKGDGTPIRSYLYAADLARWLWTLLLRGAAGRAYNLGSEQPVSIRETAEIVRSTLGTRDTVRILKTPTPDRLSERYLPSTQRAREELGLSEQINLPEAIRRTAAWHQNRGANPIRV
jgi:dTDP-glucose 4,6-dehydratase